MIINNAKLKDRIVCIEIKDGKIAAIGEKSLGRGIDAEGCEVIAGLIDVHTHGCAGFDTMDGDFAPMCDFYARHGTTSFLPTTLTSSMEDLLFVNRSKTDFPGANILGFHLEGPYISKKYKGAQNEKYIKALTTDEFAKFKNVKMITVAPELLGAEDFIKSISKETVVSIGHTDCDYGTAKTAVENGANCLTHTFNAMPPLLHRNAGPIGAAVETGIYAQLICDGFHVSKPAVIAAYRMFGADRLVLISDSMRPTGCEDGKYICGGLEVFLQNKEARLADNTIAGSVVTLWDCVKKAVEFGIPFYDAVKAATENPARLIGVKNKGRVEVGCDGDLLIIGKDMNIKKVIIGGEEYR